MWHSERVSINQSSIPAEGKTFPAFLTWKEPIEGKSDDFFASLSQHFGKGRKNFKEIRSRIVEIWENGVTFRIDIKRRLKRACGALPNARKKKIAKSRPPRETGTLRSKGWCSLLGGCKLHTNVLCPGIEPDTYVVFVRDVTSALQSHWRCVLLF